MKITISIVNIVQTALSSAFAAILYNQRKNFTSYTVREGNYIYLFLNILYS